MKGLIKNIRRFLLLVAILVINLHMIIPHDHHGDIQGKLNTCSSSGEHHPVFPPHCHALNDLVSERYLNIHLINNFDSWYFIIPEGKTNIESSCSLAGIYLKPFLLPVSSLAESSSLRAPPNFV